MKAQDATLTVQHLEAEWKRICQALDKHENALIETYLEFLRDVARTFLKKGWRVWFRPNQVVHWGEGGFGWLSILLPTGEPEGRPHLPGEIRFITDLSDKRLGEEITLATLDLISYEPDRWL